MRVFLLSNHNDIIILETNNDSALFYLYLKTNDKIDEYTRAFIFYFTAYNKKEDSYRQLTEANLMITQ